MGKALKPSQRIDLLSRILRFDLTDADAARMREELRRAEAWPELADEAMRHLVAPLLYLRGTRHGLMQEAPSEFTEFLELAHRLNGERNRRLLEQALALAQADKPAAAKQAKAAKPDKPEKTAKPAEIAHAPDQPHQPARLKDVYRNDIVPALTKQFGYKTRMQVPRISKVVLNMGVGEATSDRKILDNAIARILDNDVSAATRSTLLKQIEQPLPEVKAGSEPDDDEMPNRAGGRQARLLNPTGNPDIFKAVSLVLGTPEFQRQ